MKKLILIFAGTLFTLTIIAQDLMTIREVFDFSIGDEFQTRGIEDGQPPNADRIKILDKYYSIENDTLFYIRYHDSYYTTILMEPPYLEYHFWNKTDTVSFTNLDSLINSFVDWKPYDSTMVVYDTIIDYSEDYCDSLVNGLSYEIGEFEPVYYSRVFGKGLGLVKNSYYEPAEFSGFENVLFYFQKDGNQCGTPDYTTVSIDETKQTNSFIISPNPAINYFNIINNSGKPFNMKIFNTNGKLVISETFSIGDLDIDCSSLKPGLYVVWFSQDLNRYFRKIIIN